MQIKLVPKDGKLSEAFKYGYTMCLVDPVTLTAYHQPVNCKDYFTDIWWSEHQQKACSVYGFSWSPGRISPDAPHYMIATAFNDQDLSPYAEGMEAFLRFFDRRRNYGLSKVMPANHGTVLATTFDGRWTSQPLLISAFTQMLRLGVSMPKNEPDPLVWLDNLKENKMCPADNSRLPKLRARFRRLAEGLAYEQTYHQYETASMAHGVGGFLNAPAAAAPGEPTPRY